jgi:glycosyltransferase involved in cell wall biosynthesis
MHQDSQNDLKKIIYIIDDLHVGGAQVHLTRLASLMKERFCIEIISLGPHSDKLIAQLQKNIKITTFNMSSIRSIYFFCTSFVKLIFYLKKTTPHIVHTYLNTANVFGLLAARIAGVRNVITSRRDMGHFRTGRLATVESFLSRHLAKRVFCVCQAVARATNTKENISLEKIRVLLNGIDICQYQKVKGTNMKNTINFSMIASMNREMKGHQDFLAAIGKFSSHARADNINFFLVGDGRLRPELENISKELQIDHIVHFLGEKSNVRPILEKTDVLVVPSHSEGISNAILEAMAFGIPVIATNIDGNKEVVTDGTNGTLVPVLSPDKLCEAFIRYFEKPHLIRQHGIQARKNIENQFTLDVMKNNYFQSYEEIFMS